MRVDRKTDKLESWEDKENIYHRDKNKNRGNIKSIKDTETDTEENECREENEEKSLKNRQYKANKNRKMTINTKRRENRKCRENGEDTKGWADSKDAETRKAERSRRKKAEKIVYYLRSDKDGIGNKNT